MLYLSLFCLSKLREILGSDIFPPEHPEAMNTGACLMTPSFTTQETWSKRLNPGCIWAYLYQSGAQQSCISPHSGNSFLKIC